MMLRVVTRDRAGLFLLTRCLWLCILMGAWLSVNAQSSTSSGSLTGPTQEILTAFLSTQATLWASRQQLMSQNPSIEEIQTWYQQHATELTAQQQRAQMIAAALPRHYLICVRPIYFPAGASQTVKDFLVAKSNLSNLRAQIYNQQLQSTGEVNDSQVEATFCTQNAGAVMQQVDRAQSLTREFTNRQNTMPPPLSLPANASPDLIAFLRLRDQVLRERIKIIKQHAADSSEVSSAALQQWDQQNRTRLQQMQQQAQVLANAQTN